jgi:galactonate dehydratase
MTTSEGITGLGECVLEGRGRTVERAVDEIAEYLIGKDPRQIEHHWQALYRGTFYHGGPVLSSALSGVEQAMWDIMGKWLSVPVYTLLGGAVRSRIRVYRHVHGPSLEELRAECREAVAEGYTMVKTPLPEPSRIVDTPEYVRRQVKFMEVIREEIGWDRDFAIDFHGRVGPAMAIRLAKEFEPLQPVFIEEPCLSQNLDAMATIARSTSIPVATGERLYTKWGFRDLLQKQSAAIIQPDVCHCGGILELRKIAAMAEASFVAVAPHNALSAVNLASSLQVVATVPNFLAQEEIHLGAQLLKQPFVVRDGYIDLPQGPGLGIELDEEAMQGLVYDGSHQMPMWVHEDDGSVADW